MGVSKMDLFVRDYQSGSMPKDYYEQSIIVPESIGSDLSEITQKTERIFHDIFNNANEQLFNSLVNIVKEYSGRYEEWELEEMQESEDGKDDIAWLLSDFRKYYFCKDGITVEVLDSFPQVRYSYLVGESVLHVYEGNGLLEPKELGVILLSNNSIDLLNTLLQEALKWNGWKPLYTFYTNDRKKCIYSENFS